MSFLAKGSLVILSLTLAAAYAEATPALGDRSVYDVTLSKDTQTMQGHVTFELTAFDKSTDLWTQTTTTDFEGQKQTQTDTVATADLLDDATIDSVLTNCSAHGGKEETVKSAAGDFAACAVPVSNSSGSGTIWVSKVPFGYAKWNITRTDGVNIDSLLESFIAGGTSTTPPATTPTPTPQP